LEASAHKPEEMPAHERRQSARICCAGFAEGISARPSQLFRGEIRNVSETGCFISVRAAVALPAGTIVELRFKLGGFNYCALASVVQALPAKSIRMRFIAVDPAFTEHIRRILKSNPDPQC
jgi:hypothetical protein